MMNVNNPFQVYQKTQVQTQSPGKLILMLYDGAIRFLKQALLVMEEKNYEKTSELLIKVQDIFSELSLTLNFSAGPVAEQLHTLYGSLNMLLVEANMKSDPEIVARVLAMVEDLKLAWEAIINGPSVSENKKIVSA
jgi:flagellar protein FliS